MTFEQFKRKIQPLINIFHLSKAIFASVFYGFPSKKLILVGITGTDGKTTTTHLIYHILSKYIGKASMISSIHASVAGKTIETGAHVTTPDAIDIQNYLNKSARNNDRFFVIECTSHALNQNRLWGIKFNVAVVTNITEEHLDYHLSYIRYVNEKLKLLLNSKNIIINKDDKSYNLLSKKLKDKNINFQTYSLDKKSSFNFDASKILNIRISKFNTQNYLAAYSVLKTLKIPVNIIEKGLKSFQIPQGRMETIYDKDFKVIIDFAHTPNSFKNILIETKTFIKSDKGRIIHVFGSAGLRDYLKRPLMGEFSSSYADLIIVTEEDYRTEDLNKINRDIISGIKKNKFEYKKPMDLTKNSTKVFTIITDRESAIKSAINIAKKTN